MAVGETLSRGQVLEDGGGGGGWALRPLHRRGDRVGVAGGLLRARAQKGEGWVQGVRQEDVQEVSGFFAVEKQRKSRQWMTSLGIM